MKYLRHRPLLGNGPQTAAEERHFFCGPSRDVMSMKLVRSGVQSVSGVKIWLESDLVI
jgi:hypothetical protein